MNQPALANDALLLAFKHDRTELRDRFASAALSGMIASAPAVDRTRVNKRTWAAVAYDFADAMLWARDLGETDLSCALPRQTRKRQRSS
jgi:hypothetical protein